MPRKQKNTCHTCLDYYGCMKMDIKPSIGVCSIKRPDRRAIALDEIARKLTKAGGSACLRHAVKATADFVGNPFQIKILRVSLPDGAVAACRIFNVGEDFTTEDLDTPTLEKIARELCS